MRKTLAAACALAGAVAAAAAAGNPYAGAHRLMMAAVEIDVAMAAAASGRRELSPRVWLAMAAVPRHEFVPRDQADLAYENQALAIGHGRSLPRPYVTALVADLLEVGPADVVLELGTGSGYQAAVLSRLAGRVYTVESHPELARAAAERLARLGYDNVEVHHGDGWAGLPENAPFAGILVSGVVREVPPALLAQLAAGGRLLVPLAAGTGADLTLVWKQGRKGKVKTRPLMPVELGPLHRPTPPPH